MDHEIAEYQIREWYHLYSLQIYHYILMMIGDREEAKDLLHDTFLKAYRKFDTYEKKSQPKTWLYTIARNVVLDYKKKAKPLSLFKSMKKIVAKDPTPAESYQLKEETTVLYQALRKMNSSYQDVIILRKIKELSISETVEVLGWSESKVKTTLLRALKQLKLELEKEGYTHESSRRAE